MRGLDDTGNAIVCDYASYLIHVDQVVWVDLQPYSVSSY